MKNRRERAKQVRRRKVAQLAAYSRRHTVNNCTIPKSNSNYLREIEVGDNVKIFVNKNVGKDGNGKWKNPKEGYPQTKSLRKRYKKKYRYDDGTIRKIITHPSDYTKFPDHVYTRMSQERYNEALIAHKTDRWIRKHPRPIPDNDKEPDLFEQEFMAPWKEARDKAIEHIREVVLSKCDKLPLTGRFQKSDTEFVEEKVANIKDTEREGDKINHLDPKKSPLLKKAQKKTNQVKAKRSNLVCTNLRDRKNKKGRIILPNAA